RGTGGERKKLTRVLEATLNGPWEDRLPASGWSAASTAPEVKRRHGRYRTPFFTPVRRRAAVSGANPKKGRQPGARQRRRSRLLGSPVMWVSGQAARVVPASSGPVSGRRQRVTSKPRAPSLPTWWAICRRVLAWRS